MVARRRKEYYQSENPSKHPISTKPNTIHYTCTSISSINSEKHTIDQSNQKKKKLRQTPAVEHKKTLNHPTRITDANRIGEGRNPTDESLKKQRAKENKDVEILLVGEMSRGRVERERERSRL